MRFNIFLFIVISMYSCSSISHRQLITGDLVSNNYQYNPNGFVNSPFGRATIKTHCYYSNQKLTKILSNHPEGFLEYSLADLRQDLPLLNSFAIDTVYNLKIIKPKDKIIRNDTVFYKLENDVVLISIKE